MKVLIKKPDPQEPEDFPQLREGVVSGDLYWFESKHRSGVRISSRLSKGLGQTTVTINHTVPLPPGTSVTLTQD